MNYQVKFYSKSFSFCCEGFFPQKLPVCKFLLFKHMLKLAHPPHLNSANVQPNGLSCSTFLPLKHQYKMKWRKGRIHLVPQGFSKSP